MEQHNPPGATAPQANKTLNSRIGKAPVELPAGVSVTVSGPIVEVKGPKGTLQRDTFGRVALKQEGNSLAVHCVPGQNAAAYWGLYRTLVANMVKGVFQGFSETLEIQGTGYRATLTGKVLALNLGFSHPVQIEPPAGITFEVDKGGFLTVSGISKELVGQVAAKIVALRPAEPYQGKGIRYKGQVIRRKAGKSAAKK